jgi:single-strand DNA-binding protein
MNETMISISGNVATDLRFARSDRGTSRVSFRLASTPRRYDRSQGGWVDGRTTYVTVVCWRSLAENVAASVHKGDPVLVFGRLRVEAWERDGRSGTTVEVDAQTVGHDLTRGTSAFRRARREQREVTSDASAAEELARSWDAEPTEEQVAASSKITGPSGESGSTGDLADVGVSSEEGALPTRPRADDQGPLAVGTATSDDADRRAA